MSPRRKKVRKAEAKVVGEPVTVYESDLDRRLRRLGEMRVSPRKAGFSTPDPYLQVDQISLVRGDVSVTIAAPVGNINSHLTTTNRARHWVRGTDIGSFGVTAAGRPYYDSAGATPGEAAALTYDPATGDFSLTTGD